MVRDPAFMENAFSFEAETECLRWVCAAWEELRLGDSSCR
jgi:hypothetical protein